MTQTPSLKAYLQGQGRIARARELGELKKANASVPIVVAEDLVLLDVSPDEKRMVLELTRSEDPAALEHVLTAHLLDWPQDLAVLATRRWADGTDHILWFRMVASTRVAHLPQRVLYTILDEAAKAGGARLVEAIAAIDGLHGMSSAFQGLLLHRAVQWSVEAPTLAALAQRILAAMGQTYHPENKAMPSAIAYVLRFHPTEAPAVVESLKLEGPWREILQALVKGRAQVEGQIEKLAKLFAKPPKKELEQKIAEIWPSLWWRDTLEADVVRKALEHAQSWELFAGVPERTLVDAVLGLEDATAAIRAVATLEPLFRLPHSDQLLALVRAKATSAELKATLPARLRFAAFEDGETRHAQRWQAIRAEERETLRALEGKAELAAVTRAELSDWSAQEAGTDLFADVHLGRKAFFDTAFRGRETKAAGDGFWELLRAAWQSPDGATLPALAQAARQVDGLYRLCYIATLGRFKGEDQAALKLLDFIRSKDEDELRAVVHALGGIGTPRAQLELVATLTRPNVTPSLQLEICQILQKHDLRALQSEIRSAIRDLRAARGDDAASAALDEVKEAITGLLAPGAEADSVATSGAARGGVGEQQLDQALAGKIRHYKELSSEVKRALRTSQFFHIQVTGDDAPESIDLSPVIDMQYKALELLFRESFEETCSRIIHKGALQRRLDVIGYARPIPRAMDDFEAYIGSLPVIRDIPFFSKFKLRKMLRAICQFRPGKRFTLDGLKAFALFFLCFGRSECRYGLEGMIPLGFASDAELYDFVKTLHVLQDFRNRAAHEGFHPDASNDIDGIWRDTAQIVQTLFLVRERLEAAMAAEHAPKPQGSGRAVIIERKKVS